jgi:quercetin dioxygenase-like cupin family protein
MEAHLYILDGVGHSIVDGESIPWKPGSAFHVPGPQTVHQHVNDGAQETSMLRVAFGIRYFFEAMAKEEFPYLYLAYRQFAQRAGGERERVRERAR